MNENEENSMNREPEFEPDDKLSKPEDEWVEPPLPENIAADEIEKPKMSEIGTLFNIFIEPGKTFEDIRRKPRFIIAGLIMAILMSVFVVSFQKKIGEERYRRFVMEQNEKNPQFAALDQAQKEQSVDFGMKIQKFVPYILPVIMIAGFFIGGLLYWLGIKAMGGAGKYLQSVSVFIYSSFPPFLVCVPRYAYPLCAYTSAKLFCFPSALTVSISGAAASCKN